MIPQEKSAAVTLGLREAFGVTEFEDIRRMTGGQTSSHVFRIVVRGSPYLLKIIMRTDDATRHFTCMRSASEAGLAPRVWYTSIPDRIAITDFVEAAPFAVADALVRMPAFLRALHALPPFPGVPDHINTSCMFLMNKGAALDGFLQKVQAANLLPEGDCKQLFERYAQLAEVYPRHEADMVSSHNDLFKPDNILFDGRRVWLVDWEAAFLNDRYADLAVVANMVVTNDAEEKVFLEEYFGQPPNAYQLARFFLMRQLTHIFYAMAFLMLGSAGKPVNHSEKAPEAGDFRRSFWEGKVKLADPDMKVAYGKVHWEALSWNMRQARFDEALRTVSGR